MDYLLTLQRDRLQEREQQLPLGMGRATGNQLSIERELVELAGPRSLLRKIWQFISDQYVVLLSKRFYPLHRFAPPDLAEYST
jgi:hypothetical protein